MSHSSSNKRDEGMVHTPREQRPAQAPQQAQHENSSSGANVSEGGGQATSRSPKPTFVGEAAESINPPPRTEGGMKRGAIGKGAGDGGNAFSAPTLADIESFFKRRNDDDDDENEAFGGVGGDSAMNAERRKEIYGSSDPFDKVLVSWEIVTKPKVAASWRVNPRPQERDLLAYILEGGGPLMHVPSLAKAARDAVTGPQPQDNTTNNNSQRTNTTPSSLLSSQSRRNDDNTKSNAAVTAKTALQQAREALQYKTRVYEESARLIAGGGDGLLLLSDISDAEDDDALGHSFSGRTNKPPSNPSSRPTTARGNNGGSAPNSARGGGLASSSAGLHGSSMAMLTGRDTLRPATSEEAIVARSNAIEKFVPPLVQVALARIDPSAAGTTEGATSAAPASSLYSNNNPNLLMPLPPQGSAFGMGGPSCVLAPEVHSGALLRLRDVLEDPTVAMIKEQQIQRGAYLPQLQQMGTDPQNTITPAATAAAGGDLNATGAFGSTVGNLTATTANLNAALAQLTSASVNTSGGGGGGGGTTNYSYSSLNPSTIAAKEAAANAALIAGTLDTMHHYGHNAHGPFTVATQRVAVDGKTLFATSVQEAALIKAREEEEAREKKLLAELEAAGGGGGGAMSPFFSADTLNSPSATTLRNRNGSRSVSRRASAVGASSPPTSPLRGGGARSPLRATLMLEAGALAPPSEGFVGLGNANQPPSLSRNAAQQSPTRRRASMSHASIAGPSATATAKNGKGGKNGAKKKNAAYNADGSPTGYDEEGNLIYVPDESAAYFAETSLEPRVHITVPPQLTPATNAMANAANAALYACVPPSTALRAPAVLAATVLHAHTALLEEAANAPFAGIGLSSADASGNAVNTISAPTPTPSASAVAAMAAVGQSAVANKHAFPLPFPNTNATDFHSAQFDEGTYWGIGKSSGRWAIMNTSFVELHVSQKHERGKGRAVVGAGGAAGIVKTSPIAASCLSSTTGASAPPSFASGSDVNVAGAQSNSSRIHEMLDTYLRPLRTYGGCGVGESSMSDAASAGPAIRITSQGCDGDDNAVSSNRQSPPSIAIATPMADQPIVSPSKALFSSASLVPFVEHRLIPHPLGSYNSPPFFTEGGGALIVNRSPNRNPAGGGRSPSPPARARFGVGVVRPTSSPASAALRRRRANSPNTLRDTHDDNSPLAASIPTLATVIHKPSHLPAQKMLRQPIRPNAHGGMDTTIGISSHAHRSSNAPPPPSSLFSRGQASQRPTSPDRSGRGGADGEKGSSPVPAAGGASSRPTSAGGAPALPEKGNAPLGGPPKPHPLIRGEFPSDPRRLVAHFLSQPAEVTAASYACLASAHYSYWLERALTTGVPNAVTSNSNASLYANFPQVSRSAWEALLGTTTTSSSPSLSAVSPLFDVSLPSTESSSHPLPIVLKNYGFAPSWPLPLNPNLTAALSADTSVAQILARPTTFTLADLVGPGRAAPTTIPSALSFTQDARLSNYAKQQAAAAEREREKERHAKDLQIASHRILFEQQHALLSNVAQYLFTLVIGDANGTYIVMPGRECVSATVPPPRPPSPVKSHTSPLKPVSALSLSKSTKSRSGGGRAAAAGGKGSGVGGEEGGGGTMLFADDGEDEADDAGGMPLPLDATRPDMANTVDTSIVFEANAEDDGGEPTTAATTAPDGKSQRRERRGSGLGAAQPQLQRKRSNSGIEGTAEANARRRAKRSQQPSAADAAASPPYHPYPTEHCRKYFLHVGGKFNSWGAFAPTADVAAMALATANSDNAATSSGAVGGGGGGGGAATAGGPRRRSSVSLQAVNTFSGSSLYTAAFPKHLAPAAAAAFRADPNFHEPESLPTVTDCCAISIKSDGAGVGGSSAVGPHHHCNVFSMLPSGFIRLGEGSSSDTSGVNADNGSGGGTDAMLSNSLGIHAAPPFFSDPSLSTRKNGNATNTEDAIPSLLLESVRAAGYAKVERRFADYCHINGRKGAHRGRQGSIGSAHMSHMNTSVGSSNQSTTVGAVDRTASMGSSSAAQQQHPDLLFPLPPCPPEPSLALAMREVPIANLTTLDYNVFTHLSRTLASGSSEKGGGAAVAVGDQQQALCVPTALSAQAVIRHWMPSRWFFENSWRNQRGAAGGGAVKGTTAATAADPSSVAASSVAAAPNAKQLLTPMSPSRRSRTRSMSRGSTVSTTAGGGGGQQFTATQMAAMIADPFSYIDADFMYDVNYPPLYYKRRGGEGGGGGGGGGPMDSVMASSEGRCVPFMTHLERAALQGVNDANVAFSEIKWHALGNGGGGWGLAMPSSSSSSSSSQHQCRYFKPLVEMLHPRKPNAPTNLALLMAGGGGATAVKGKESKPPPPPNATQFPPTASSTKKGSTLGGLRSVAAVSDARKVGNNTGNSKPPAQKRTASNTSKGR